MEVQTLQHATLNYENICVSASVMIGTWVKVLGDCARRLNLPAIPERQAKF